MTIIELRQLTRRYGRRIGVEALNLVVPDGVVYGFLGPNGAGKSTTIRVLMGFLRPSEGQARLFGLDCWRDGPRIRADVGYLPGDLRLYSWMTGHDALRLVGRVRHRDLIVPGRNLAERFNLELGVRVGRMSRGMRQKLGLILALAHKPRLLILDEPTSSLDPIMQEQLYLHLRELANRGHTVFFSSHTLSEVQRLCDRLAIVREGRLVADDTLENMQAQARREVTIRWRDSAARSLSPPQFLDVHERDDRQWRASLNGTVSVLVQWLADKPIDDLSIGQPDLESLFRRYYEQVETLR